MYDEHSTLQLVIIFYFRSHRVLPSLQVSQNALQYVFLLILIIEDILMSLKGKSQGFNDRGIEDIVEDMSLTSVGPGA